MKKMSPVRSQEKTSSAYALLLLGVLDGVILEDLREIPIHQVFTTPECTSFTVVSFSTPLHTLHNLISHVPIAFTFSPNDKCGMDSYELWVLGKAEVLKQCSLLLYS